MTKYIPAYMLCCWLQVVMTILESVFEEYPYRYDYTYGTDGCRPQSYSEYVKFRYGQDQR